MTVLRWLSLAVGLYATAAIPVVLDAHAVDTWLPAWAERHALTLAALLLILGGTNA